MFRREILVSVGGSPPPALFLQRRGLGEISPAPAVFENDAVRVCAWHLRAAAVWG